MKTVVLGLGNCLLCDEGVGVHAVRALMAEGLEETAELLEVGTALLDALPAIARAGRLVIIDAMRGGGEPGSIYRVDLADCQPAACIGSLHGFDLRRVMALAGRDGLLPGTVYGVEPARIEWSLELSPVVASVLPVLLPLLRRELQPALQEPCSQTEKSHAHSAYHVVAPRMRSRPARNKG